MWIDAKETCAEPSQVFVKIIEEKTSAKDSKVNKEYLVVNELIRRGPAHKFCSEKMNPSRRQIAHGTDCLLGTRIVYRSVSL